MAFTTVLDPRAMQDIQQAIDYYDEQQPGLGEQFEDFVNECLVQLEQNPFFQIRYDDIHCFPLKKYPYMIHFLIDEHKQLITVMAVFNTAKDPKIWKERK
ncbi:MAG: type II toxin-antitoxin system RelE/ParE family toxin [Balneolaceae bacterium]|nr:type II toxin-antitoxin system RelE/ParE family toxin [Balneolaceae bacterium]MBO6546913.1 type II toxin-antitoxin system RelE/ParE family toxin [Balneolaceae bacterium]MBO6649273.1 type II toxin-antitoxin system RelE/ParE family toxin [Balneolaceae bacterium]